MKKLMLSLAVSVLVISIGCDRDRHDNVSVESFPAKLLNTTRLSNGESLPDGGNVPAQIQKLMEFKRNGNMVEYLACARDFLETNRNEFIAADVMTTYAQMRMTNEFKAFGLAYATNSPTLLLEFAEIANNEAWQPMTAKFAQLVASRDNASYAELYRSARFLLLQGCADAVTEFMPRIRSSAVKRYQKEDAELLACELAICRGGVSEETRKSLSRLANEAMMPQVRKNAANLMKSICAKE